MVPFAAFASANRFVTELRSLVVRVGRQGGVTTHESRLGIGIFRAMALLNLMSLFLDQKLDRSVEERTS